MARVKIREFDAKKLIFENLNQKYKGILIGPDTDLENLPVEFPWLLGERLVIKPDQLFGKRAKLGLVFLNKDFDEVKEYLKENLNKEIPIGNAIDKLTHFLIEPYVEHEKEYYLSIGSFGEDMLEEPRNGYNLFFSCRNAGINVEENWDKVENGFKWVTSSFLKTGFNYREEDIERLLKLREEVSNQIINEGEKKKIIDFFIRIYGLFLEFDFTYLEFNPFTFNKEGEIIILDTVSSVDDCAFKWKNVVFPKPFGKKSLPEEEFIESLDKESGASLKLTILNPKGRIWNILSGGGASIIYLDAIANLGKQEEIANYGEYSGNPTTEETYQYTKTILNLMTKEHNPNGKVLIIGGAIANFTDVEKTFSGIIKALKENKVKLKEGKISVFVRRGGPNYEKGLKLIEQTGKELEIPMIVHGPDKPMTKIIEIAIGALV